MKRIIAGVACTFAITGAQAQSSVTLYGLIDAGVQYLTNANAAGKSQWSQTSGAYLPSRFGIRGREDLGGGYAAYFTLENGFNANDGTQATTTSFFNRFAFVGIDTPYGSISAGRQGSVQYDKTVFYEPLYYGNYSQLSLNAAPIAIFKLNNTVKYQSKSFAGFNFEAQYGFGQELPGQATAGRYIGAAIEYVHEGLSARVLHEQTRGSITGAIDQSSLVDKRTSVAAVYQAQWFSLFADWTRVTGDLQLSPRGSVYSVGASYLPKPDIRLVAEAGMYKRTSLSGTPKLFDFMAQYFLSKRTSVYLIGGYMINSGNTSNGVVYTTATSKPGQTQLGLSLGVDHRF